MPYFLLTQDKYKTLEADVLHSGKVKKIIFQNDYQGTMTTDDVTLSFSYDPLTLKLTYEIGARLSLAAHLASDNIIANHITKMLSQIESAPVSVYADDAPLPETTQVTTPESFPFTTPAVQLTQEASNGGTSS